MQTAVLPSAPQGPEMNRMPEMPHVEPVVYTSGVYRSGAATGEGPVLPQEASTERVERLAENDYVIPRAVGMAALPEGSLGEQLTSLTYMGKTSEQYAADHAAWLTAFHHQNMAAEAFHAQNEDDDEEDSDAPKVTKKTKPSRKSFELAA